MAGPWERYAGGAQVVPADRLKVQGAVLGNSQTAAQTGRTVVQTRGDQIDNRTKAATQPYVVRKTKADAIAAEQTAQGLTPQIMEERRARRESMKPLGGIINELTDQYNRSFKGAGGSSGRGRFAEYMPGKIFGNSVNPTNELFNSTAMRAAPFVTNLLFPGSKATDAAKEYEQKVMPYIPQAGDSDKAKASKLNQLARLYNQAMGVKPTKASKPAPAAKVIDFKDWTR